MICILDNLLSPSGWWSVPDKHVARGFNSPGQDVIEKVLAANLLALRIARGQSQQELAERAGFARASIANIEAGRQNIRLSTLSRLAAALGVPAGALLTEEGADGFMMGWHAGCEATRVRLVAFLNADAKIP